MNTTKGLMAMGVLLVLGAQGCASDEEEFSDLEDETGTSEEAVKSGCAASASMPGLDTVTGKLRSEVVASCPRRAKPIVLRMERRFVYGEHTSSWSRSLPFRYESPLDTTFQMPLRNVTNCSENANRRIEFRVKVFAVMSSGQELLDTSESSTFCE